MELVHTRKLGSGPLDVPIRHLCMTRTEPWIQ